MQNRSQDNMKMMQQNISDAASLASSALEESTAAQQVATATATELTALTQQMQALKLGLECVEGGLEDIDVRDALKVLRSRLDDLDTAVEKTSGSAHIGELKCALSGLKDDLDQLKQDSGANIAALRAQMTAMSASPPSPALAAGVSGENAPALERLRAALSTLSSSHNSLLQALTLVHKDQHELSARVSAVGEKVVYRDDDLVGQGPTKASMHHQGPGEFLSFIWWFFFLIWITRMIRIRYFGIFLNVFCFCHCSWFSCV